MAKSSIDVEVQVLSETAERLILRWIYGKRYRDLTAEELWLVLSKQYKKVLLYENNWRRKHGLPMMRRRR